MTSSILSSAAVVCGLPDPAVMAQRLAALPVDQLAACGHYAGALAVALFQGSHLAQDAAAATRTAWSTGTAATAIGQSAMAAMAARSVLTTQSGALDGAGSVMRQLQTLAVAAVADAESALRQTGFDASTGRAATATVTQLPFPLSNPAGTEIDGTRGVITPIVTAAHDRLLGLVSRLDAAVHELALALRSDPRDLLQRLPALGTLEPEPAGAGTALLAAAAAGSVGAWGAAAGGLLGGGAPGAGACPSPAVGDVASGSTAVGAGSSAPTGMTAPATAADADADARFRLAKDLESDDEATVFLAKGVADAIATAEASGQTVQLLTYTSASTTTQGTAAIGLGDLATADSVTTVVPGIMNHPAAMTGALGDAARLRSEAHRRSPDQSSAVVAWFGYDFPLSAASGPDADRVADVTSALDDGAAVAGGTALAADLSRFRSYAPQTARQVAIGHSMGSVVVSAAAAQGAAVDDLVLVGSPGASRLADSAGDYPNVAAGHTWVIALDDPVTRSETDAAAIAGRALSDTPLLMNPATAPLFFANRATDALSPPHGEDPATAEFGATVVDAVGARPAIPDFAAPTSPFALSSPKLTDWVHSLGNHPMDNYFSATSLTAMADIAAGHAADVRTKPAR